MFRSTDLKRKLVLDTCIDLGKLMIPRTFCIYDNNKL